MNIEGTQTSVPRMKRVAACIAPVILCLVAAMIMGGSQQTPMETMRIGGRDRTFIVRLPSALPANKKLPLVIVLHGGGGHGLNAETMTQMTPFADRKGFIVVYPNGTGRQPMRFLSWNAGNCCAYAMENNVDDIKFLRELIFKLKATHPVDPQRIYVTGLSNGGMMSHRVAMELGDLVAAVGPVAGAMNSSLRQGPKVGIMMIHGDADQHVLIGGGVPKVSLAGSRNDRSLAEAVKFWRKRNNLDDVAPKVEQQGAATITTYDGDFDVQTVVIKGEGHTWPGGRKGAPRMDQPSTTVIANELLWEFFQRHQRDPEIAHDKGV